MKFFLYILFMIVLIGIIFIVIFLPKTQIIEKSKEYNYSAKKIYEVMTNNKEWKYRTGLDELNILETDGEYQVWEEVSAGNKIRFKTKEKIKYSFYSFEMESKAFTGEWSAELKEIDANKTIVVMKETVEFNNIFMRILGYFFFDLAKYVEIYQEDLRKKLEVSE